MEQPLREWIRFKPNLCKTCWATCCHDMPLEASVADFIRMGWITEAEAAASLSQLSKRLKKEGLIQSYRRKNMTFVIAQKKNKDCIFLNSKSRRCTIYSKRPEICRTFPKLSPKPNHCPYEMR